MVQGLINDFHGQQCTTTLPMCVESFMAWMHGTRGSLDEDADVLKVLVFHHCAVFKSACSMRGCY